MLQCLDHCSTPYSSCFKLYVYIELHIMETVWVFSIFWCLCAQWYFHGSALLYALHAVQFERRTGSWGMVGQVVGVFCGSHQAAILAALHGASTRTAAFSPSAHVSKHATFRTYGIAMYVSCMQKSVHA
jgi:hypothetical protein